MRFCTNCGSQLADNVVFCPSCGTKMEAAAEQQQQQFQQPVYQQPVQVQPEPIVSKWDGGVLDTFGNALVASLLITITCGIGTPWAICYMWKFIIGHAVVDGKRLKFTGTGGRLFGNWLKWALLTLITCGIYSFWVTPKMYNWLVSNTHFE